VFAGKVNWLDLHRNRLDRVRNHGGQGGRSLTFLDLSENQLERLDALDIPDQVMMLYLSDNRIAHVASGAFIAKRNLTVADLSGNHLTGKWQNTKPRRSMLRIDDLVAGRISCYDN
jgi:Leucine-rich repeat (LRR) protein